MATQRPNYPKEKMFYQQWWFWLILAGFILGLIALLRPSTGSTLENVLPTTALSDSATTTGVASTSEKQEIALLNSNYYLDDDGEYIYWVAEYKNPEGNSSAYYLPKIIVTAYDGAGAVLATEEQVMMGLQPGERQIFGSTMDVHGQKPSRVDFSIESGTTRMPSEDALKASDFQIDGVTERQGGLGNNVYTGTVKNNGSKDTSEVCVVVALKQDGKVVFAENTFVDDLAAGQQKPFELNTFGDLPQYNSYEVMAYDWNY